MSAIDIFKVIWYVIVFFQVVYWSAYFATQGIMHALKNAGGIIVTHNQKRPE